MNDETTHPIGVYRSTVDLELRVTYSDGTTERWSDVPTADQRCALKAAGAMLKDTGTDWFVGIGADHRKGQYDDMQSGDGRDQEDNQSGDPGDNGDGEGDDGEPSDEDSDGDGEGESEGEPQEGEEMDFNQREGQGNEDAPIDSDALANDLWPHLVPNVRVVAENYARYAAEYAVRSALAQGAGSGSYGSDQGSLKFEQKKFNTPDVKHHQYEKVRNIVARGLNAYLPGPPGTGKSHMIKQIAEELGRPYHIDSFSPMSTESKLNGFIDANGKLIESGYRKAFLGGWIYGGDELDNSNPAIVTGLNSGLANGVHAFPDGTYPVHPDFVMIATANTLGTGPTAEFAGRQKLDPATLNRFVKVYIDTDEVLEDQIVHAMIGKDVGDKWLRKVRQVRRAVADLKIKHFVTMRDSINGAKLIAPGPGQFSQLEALEHTILAVLSPDQVDKIKAWRG